MKKILLSGVVAGIVLLVLSYLIMLGVIQFFPSLTDEYFSPVFNSSGERDILYYFHPFVLSFALAWVWDRFKGVIKGNFIMRGIEFGLIYGIVATIPSMWITYSAIDISLQMIGTWLLYGFVQAVVAGFIFEKTNP